MKNKIMKYNDPYFGDIFPDVLRMSNHATQRATERKIPVEELLQQRSHINGSINKVVSKSGVIITAYPRSTRNFELPENAKRFTFPSDGIGIFIGKQGVNIKRIQAEYQLKSLHFDQSNYLIAVPSTNDYDWAPFETMVEIAQKRKYRTKQQSETKKKEKNSRSHSDVNKKTT